LDPALRSLAGPEVTDGHDIVIKLADYMLHDIGGFDRDLLKKSLLETLLSLFALDPEFHRSVFSDRFLRFLKLHGTSALIRHFLSIHIFNLIWLQTMDAFRGLARTQDVFMKDMQSLEHACSLVVDMSWKLAHVTRPLNMDSVCKLLHEVEKHLWGE
jgi:hypothetical protein